MAWRKSPQQLIETFSSTLPSDPRVEPRKMFGYLAAFVNGNLFAGLHQESFILRLPRGDREKLLRDHGAKIFEPMAGRPMREYVVLPEALLADRAAVGALLARSLAYAAELPAKTKAPTTRKRLVPRFRSS